MLAVEEPLPASIVWLPVAAEHAKRLAGSCHRHEQLAQLRHPAVATKQAIHLKAMRLAVRLKLNTRVGVAAGLLDHARRRVGQLVDLAVG